MNMQGNDIFRLLEWMEAPPDKLVDKREWAPEAPGLGWAAS
ncbi:hypothetical protein V491_05881, partial [Pseudogymnoascus sp. VKM F-3775]